MKGILIAAISGLVLSVAGACAQVSGVTQPPRQFAGKPLLTVEEHVLPFKDVTDTCRRLIGDRKEYLGCATVLPGRCVIYRVNDDRVKRHEIGHCNGWGSDHSLEEVSQVSTVLERQRNLPTLIQKLREYGERRAREMELGRE